MLICTNTTKTLGNFYNRNVLANIISDDVSGKKNLVIEFVGTNDKITIQNVVSYRKDNSEFLDVYTCDGECYWTFLDRGEINGDSRGFVRVGRNTLGISPCMVTKTSEMLVASSEEGLYFLCGGKKIYTGEIISADCPTPNHVRLCCQNGDVEFYY